MDSYHCEGSVINMSISIFDSASSLSSYFSNSLGSSSASMPFSLSDYAQIKNGSYGKLMKAYYANVASDLKSSSTSTTDSTDTTDTSDVLSSLTSSGTSTTGTSSTSGTTTTATTDKTAATDAKNLAAAADDLKTATYSQDNISDLYSKVSSFVESYNSAVTSGSSSDVSSVQNNTEWMEGTTSSNKNLLSSVGITIGDDNKLTLDKSTFENADMTTLKDVFGGDDSYSYSNQISARADNIYDLAASGGTSGTSYTSSASYTAAASGTMYDTTT